MFLSSAIEMKSIVTITLLAFVFVCQSANAEDTELPNALEVENRIVGGEPAKYNQFPFQVRLVLTKKIKEKLENTLCGGVLIADRFILTAGHCANGSIGGYAFLGTTNLQNKEATRVVLTLKKENFVVHQNFNLKKFQHDIGLVILPNPVKFNEGIRPIRLPPLGAGSFENHIGIISGFGKTGDKSQLSMKLLYAKRRILPANFCRYWYPYIFWHPMHICVDASQMKSSCFGDSGGPLVVREADGYYSVLGVTSFGTTSCEKGIPTVYTRISSYLSWIHYYTGIPIRRW